MVRDVALRRWLSILLGHCALGPGGGLAVHAVEDEAGEDEGGAEPLAVGEHVAEEDDGAEDGEELPGGGSDGAGQRAELGHAHEDEVLAQRRGHREQRQLAQHRRVALDEREEGPGGRGREKSKFTVKEEKNETA